GLPVVGGKAVSPLVVDIERIVVRRFAVQGAHKDASHAVVGSAAAGAAANQRARGTHRPRLARQRTPQLRQSFLEMMTIDEMKAGSASQSATKCASGIRCMFKSKSA